MARPLEIITSLLLAGSTCAASSQDSLDWWSLQPLRTQALPESHVAGLRTPVDAFISAKLLANGLTMSPEADPRTLIRRLYFDLTGLPPAPEEVDAFTAGKDPEAYAKLVDRLLASPRYGERWARHWLDVVHYGDTHGYDKDQPRPNAWPFRDYVIRALNGDKPYAQFVQEQLAGDVLYPGTRDGIEALGFIAAGPWDLIGHAEVGEDKIDGKIARHLDRDDMVSNTINTFCSLTVHCAQCHDHKFDPIKQADYYNLQSVFAALDRADRDYDTDPATAKQRSALLTEQKELKAKVESLTASARAKSGDTLAALDKLITEQKKPASSLAAQSGWHSAIAGKQDTEKWVQVDLGERVALSSVVLHACQDDFAGIGEGFGFPVRFKIEVSDDAAFAKDVRVLVDETLKDFANPKLKPVSIPAAISARCIRITATKLALRQNDYIFSIAELEVLDAAGKNRAYSAAVTSLDSIEAPPRWQRSNLTDSWYPGVDPAKPASVTADTAKLEQARRLILEAALGGKSAAELDALERGLGEVEKKLSDLPAAGKVYCGTVHSGSGAFAGTGAKGGSPRTVFVLARGDVTRPGAEAVPGSVSAISVLPGRFVLPRDAPEGQRRAALAHWITDRRNPLTWRSIVNRVWQYHFGRGLVDSPNDFGKMGQLPSHPELLDWLAADFRASGGSFKKLHRLIVTSAVYRQSSVLPQGVPPGHPDPENHLLWRMNSRKLEAEAVRDSILAVSGLLDLKMGGPAFQDFVVTHPEHSPHYEYHLADLTDPKLHRRSVYRFLARSKPQPWMATLDCADPSMLVEKRTQTITPLQALAQMNNQLTLVASLRFAERLERERKILEDQVGRGMWLALGREGTARERKG